ncbi:MAG TPA: tRNA uridine(34) 5-carboxymethylaminomethyl modification radical SAM/GNAT enzyme Elp3 [Nitrososphaerales archaeon]|nr:tRNA uridine(34) 5-carboxymethylaminomethyl modification radical SAM/GNAT enzyme Elp3 [Nitrososphaerales archaeon]
MTDQFQSGLEAAVAFVAEQVSQGKVGTRAQLEKLKKRAASEFALDRYLTNSEVIGTLPLKARSEFEEMLRVHPRRSASGIVVVTAFSAPFACPHGTCTFCPGGPRFGTPQSYLKHSPGMKAALETGFDPYVQVRKCLAKYRANGHEVSKVETIIEGGTFIAVPREYQTAFVKGVYDGLNGAVSASLEQAQATNESSSSRCVGLTLESKPDWCRPEDIDLMLSYGITRLEIGVQTLRNEVLSRSNRGHTVEETVRAFQVARDAGLKLTAHMMPGLPGATPEEDLEDLRQLFEDEAFRPDMSKIYPTLVVPGTTLSQQFKRGSYHPYSLETVVELLSEAKRFVPGWHRIMRIQREIPAKEIEGGVRAGNLRQLVLSRAREKGYSCNCIRCREVMLREPEAMLKEDALEYVERRYTASEGEEVFGSYEFARSGVISAFVRMRVPSPLAHRPEMNRSAVVRELRVYGRTVRVGQRENAAWQHRGLGVDLMRRMEKVAAEDFGANRLLVTSAVGTRGYYRKLGYERSGPYMVRSLK